MHTPCFPQLDPAKKASAMGGVTLYGTSKLMNVLHAKALATRALWLVVNAVHPGIIKTELHDEHGSPYTYPTHARRLLIRM